MATFYFEHQNRDITVVFPASFTPPCILQDHSRRWVEQNIDSLPEGKIVIDGQVELDGRCDRHFKFAPRL